MSFTKTQIDEFARRLKELPAVVKPANIKKVEAIKTLKPEILAMQKKGYTLEKISEVLTELGMEIKTTTLKAYLQKSNPKKKINK